MPLTISDELIIGATLLGPVLAVQAQKWVEGIRQKRNRKRQIFTALMATRATRVANEHVQALNMIDIEFTDSKFLGFFKQRKDKQVLDEWRKYFDILNEKVADDAPEAVRVSWNDRSVAQFVKMLHAMSGAVGFDFNEAHINRGIYWPKAHTKAEAAQLTIRDNLAEVLTGRRSIPMAVTHFPSSDDAINLQLALQTALLGVIKGDEMLKVSIAKPQPEEKS